MTADPPGRSTATVTDQILTSLQGRYPETQYHFVRFFSEHLVDCYRVFGGDFDQVILLAVMGQRYLEAVMDARALPGRGLDQTRISALRLADVTGLPRETVRRKLKLLEQRGWVVCEKGKGWTLAGDFPETRAREGLKDLDQRGLQRLARLMAALRPILSAGSGVTGPADQKA
jgi:predicted transcriptional regulator